MQLLNGFLISCWRLRRMLRDGILWEFGGWSEFQCQAASSWTVTSYYHSNIYWLTGWHWTIDNYEVLDNELDHSYSYLIQERKSVSHYILHFFRFYFLSLSIYLFQFMYLKEILKIYRNSSGKFFTKKKLWAMEGSQCAASVFFGLK